MWPHYSSCHSYVLDLKSQCSRDGFCFFHQVTGLSMKYYYTVSLARLVSNPAPVSDTLLETRGIKKTTMWFWYTCNVSQLAHCYLILLQVLSFCCVYTTSDMYIFYHGRLVVMYLV